MMKAKSRNNGSVLLIAIFVIALLSAVVMGILQVNTEEIQLVRNQMGAAQALVVAEAGLNDAFAQIRADDAWVTGFADKVFEGGSYVVTVAGTLPNLKITSTGTSAQGFVARVEADVTLGASAPYVVRIDNLRINE
jgi:Tfp pilus assembly protein PilX